MYTLLRREYEYVLVDNLNRFDIRILSRSSSFVADTVKERPVCRVSINIIVDDVGQYKSSIEDIQENRAAQQMLTVCLKRD